MPARIHSTFPWPWNIFFRFRASLTVYYLSVSRTYTHTRSLSFTRTLSNTHTHTHTRARNVWLSSRTQGVVVQPGSRAWPRCCADSGPAAGKNGIKNKIGSLGLGRKQNLFDDDDDDDVWRSSQGRLIRERGNYRLSIGSCQQLLEFLQLFHLRVVVVPRHHYPEIND